ncbi:MAG: dTMP kinase [Spirochaetes bacterium]|jgi:dTMP kinase|nr:dTMP kinase [Spirochaetota bacterium]
MNNPSSIKSLFVLFEGIDGSGKTTIIDSVNTLLSKEALPVTVLREPTSGRHGQKLRTLLAEKTEPDRALLLDLFITDRLEDVTLNIKPALEKKQIILMDRYYYSTAAYQGRTVIDARKIVEQNQKLAVPEPDMIFFLDITPETAFKRVTERRSSKDIECFEKIERMQHIDEIYRAILPETTRFLNAGLSPEVIAGQAVSMIKDFL